MAYYLAEGNIKRLQPIPANVARFICNLHRCPSSSFSPTLAPWWGFGYGCSIQLLLPSILVQSSPVPSPFSVALSLHPQLKSPFLLVSAPPPLPLKQHSSCVCGPHLRNLIFANIVTALITPKTTVHR